MPKIPFRIFMKPTTVKGYSSVYCSIRQMNFLKNGTMKKIVVAYGTNKKKHFFFREKQKLKPALLPSRRNSVNGHYKDMMNKNNLYISTLIQS